MAEIGLTHSLKVAFDRARRVEKLITLLLLFILLSAATAGVTDVLTGPDWGLLWTSLLCGLLIGWVLAILRWSAWKSALIILLAGLLFTLLTAGSLGDKIWAVFLESLHLPAHIITAPNITGIDISLLKSLTAQVASALEVLLGRVISWLEALITSQPAFDPVAAGIVWSTLVWMVAAWAGWIVEAGRNAILAVLPAMLLNLGTLSYGQSRSKTIYLILGVTLVLIAVVQYDQREQEWDENMVAYPVRKDRQVNYTAATIAIVLVLAAAFLSTLSIKRITKWASEIRGPSEQHESGLAKSLGIRAATTTPDAFTPIRSPGLPRELLIGSGPELSTELVMSVEVKNLASLLQAGQLPPIYWRSFTYDIYTGHGWSSSATQQVQYQADQQIQTSQIMDHLLIQQIVRPMPGMEGTIYASGESVLVNIPTRAAWRASNDLFGIQAGDSGYEAQSLIPVVDADSLRAAGQRYPTWITQRYLALPQEVPARIKQLAIQLTATEPTPYDRARAIEQYLRKYTYSLDIPRPPSNRDLVDFFLYDLQKGYCDYYASAMVVLARAAGIPARLAIGYASGTYNLNSKRFIVTQADAHSWVEVYFPGIGWMPFEPTAAQPEINRSIQPTPEVPVTPGAPGSSAGVVRTNAGEYLAYAGLTLAVIACILWPVYDELRLQRMEQRPLAAEIYRRMRRYARLLRLTTNPGETPLEFAASLNAEVQELTAWRYPIAANMSLVDEIQRITNAIVRLSYRPSELEAASGEKILSQWRLLRWHLRRMWIVKRWQSLIQQLRERLVGLRGETNIQVE